MWGEHGRLVRRVEGVCRQFIAGTCPWDHDGRTPVDVQRNAFVEKWPNMKAKVTCEVWHNKPGDRFRWKPDGWRSGLLEHLANALRREGLHVEEVWADNERACLIVGWSAC